MKYILLIIILFYVGIGSGFAQHKKFVTYKVSEGETVVSISKGLLITPYDLLNLNPDIDKNVKAGDILVIPNKDYDPSKEIAIVDLQTITDLDIVVDNYIYHKVLPKETLYSIQKKFKVSTEELNDLNPYLLKGGLKIGNVLKIPLQIKEAQILEIDATTQPYLVKAKETKYSIARIFDISIDYLEQLNPKIKEAGLQIGDVIRVPKETSGNDNSEFSDYTIEKSETLYSLSNKFEISQEELIMENPQLEEGVKEGMLIKIPNKGDLSTDIFIDEIVVDRKIELAMMLPFRSKRDSLDFENDRLLNITTEFYLGALLAIDSLKNQGLSIRMKVYDTENSRDVSKKLSLGREFDNYDVVIGPLFLDNVKVVSENLQFKKSLIISPISTKDHSKIRNINLVQEVPTKAHLTLEMIEYIKSIYSDQKLIVILDEEGERDADINSLLRDLEDLNGLESVAIIKPDEGYIKPEVFKENIVEDRENWFLLIGSDGVIASDVVNNIGVLPVEINVTLFSFDKGKGFNKIDNNFLARVNFHYASFQYLDIESKELRYFVNRYIKSYKTYPTKYAIEGFDITYDILMRLANENTDLKNQGISERLATKYNYIENTSNSILNKGIFIVRYDGLNLSLVDGLPMEEVIE
jgi:LysM repeat protein